MRRFVVGLALGAVLAGGLSAARAGDGRVRPPGGPDQFTRCARTFGLGDAAGVLLTRVCVERGWPAGSPWRP